MSRLTYADACRLLDINTVESVDASLVELAYSLQIERHRRYRRVKAAVSGRKMTNKPSLGEAMRIGLYEEAYQIVLEQLNQAHEASNTLVTCPEPQVSTCPLEPVVTKSPFTLDMNQFYSWSIFRGSLPGQSRSRLDGQPAIGPGLPDGLKHPPYQAVSDVFTLRPIGTIKSLSFIRLMQLWAPLEGQLSAEWLLDNASSIPFFWYSYHLYFPSTIWTDRQQNLHIPEMSFAPNHNRWLIKFTNLNDIRRFGYRDCVVKRS